MCFDRGSIIASLDAHLQHEAWSRGVPDDCGALEGGQVAHQHFPKWSGPSTALACSHWQNVAHKLKSRRKGNLSLSHVVIYVKLRQIPKMVIVSEFSCFLLYNNIFIQQYDHIFLSIALKWHFRCVSRGTVTLHGVAFISSAPKTQFPLFFSLFFFISVAGRISQNWNSFKFMCQEFQSETLYQLYPVLA